MPLIGGLNDKYSNLEKTNFFKKYDYHNIICIDRFDF